MTDKEKGILMLSGAALWYYVLRGVNAFSVSIKSFRVNSISGDTINCGLTLLIKNPLLVGLLINDIVGDIYIMGIPVATVDFPLNQRIYKRSVSPIDINFNVSYSAVGQSIFANMQTGDIRTLLVRFDGYLQSGKVKLPFDREFTYDDIF